MNDRLVRVHVGGRDADARRLDDVDGVDADAVLWRYRHMARRRSVVPWVGVRVPKLFAYRRAIHHERYLDVSADRGGVRAGLVGPSYEVDGLLRIGDGWQ